MKIIDVKSLSIPEIKVIRFGRFCDHRGYFTEPFRKSDFFGHPDLAGAFKGVEFVQTNESVSRPNTIRGLHFQWNPYMGKLVRTLSGKMVDVVLDIRKGSPTFGKAIAYDMPGDPAADYTEWIWVPPGFAHGNFFTKKSMIEYFCSGEYSEGCEAGVSPFSKDIDWSLCDTELKELFDAVINSPDLLISDKDRNGPSLKDWVNDERSNNFIYGEL